MSRTNPRPSRPAARVAVAGAFLAAVVGACAPAAIPAVPSDLAVPSPGVAAPSVAPVVQAQDAAIEAFVDHASSGEWTYRMTFKGDVAMSASRWPVKGSVDVAGDDFATSITYDLRSEGIGINAWRVQLREVKGKGWIKATGTGWQSVEGFRDEENSIPFISIEAPEDVRYVGPDKFKGEPVHRVTISGAVIVHPATLPGYVSSESIDRTALELLIDDKGRPRSGEWKLFGRGRVGGNQLQHIDYVLDLTFSKVGGKIKVSRP